MELSKAVAALESFGSTDLTRTLARIEVLMRDATADECASALTACGAGCEVLAAAALMKQLAGQINVIIHTLGILLCLPHLLLPEEVIKYVSLGAGNTGRAFDLETNLRIAEFKFIRWQGGPEAIRQNALFKDFYLMAEHATEKKKFLYVLGTEHPLKFFNSGRAISSVLSRNVKLQKQFIEKFGESYRTVHDYYRARGSEVTLQDVSGLLPGLNYCAIEQEESTI